MVHLNFECIFTYETEFQKNTKKKDSSYVTEGRANPYSKPYIWLCVHCQNYILAYPCIHGHNGASADRTYDLVLSPLSIYLWRTVLNFTLFTVSAE